GNPTCTSGNGEEDQFFFVGGSGLWCIRCSSYGGGERGFNTGIIYDPNLTSDWTFRFRDLRAWDNGATCGANHFCSGAGILTSGNDFSTGHAATTFILGAVLFHNAITGAGTYGGGSMEVWNATSYSTNYTAGYEGSYELDATAKDFRLYSSIDL